MWDIVWVSPQGHRSVSVSRHFLLQAPQCLFRAKTVQQKPLLPREIETRLLDCGVTIKRVDNLPPHLSCSYTTCHYTKTENLCCRPLNSVSGSERNRFGM